MKDNLSLPTESASTVLYVYGDVCRQIHTSVRSCVHSYLHTFLHSCMHTYMHTYMHTCARTHTHTCKHTHVCSFVCLPVCLSVCLHVFTYGCMYVSFTARCKLSSVVSAVTQNSIPTHKPCTSYFISWNTGDWVPRIPTEERPS